jgi:alpha,alpha-trehalase
VEKGYFFDFDMNTRKQSEIYSLAGLYPLFLHIADPIQAESVLEVIRQQFLMDGGLVTTLENTGQQWDYPNGWPPLQWIGYEASKNYGHDVLAEEIASRWLGLNKKVFSATGKMMEKYDVADTTRPGGGGEYETQDGFGWTNGVFLKMWSEQQGN